MYILEDGVLAEKLAEYGFHYDKELDSWIIDCYSKHIPNYNYEVKVGRFLVRDRMLYAKLFIDNAQESFNKLKSKIIKELLHAKIIKEAKG